MAEAEPFVDHYKILGVDPSCDARALETAYHLQAKRYHPDHAESADVERFAEVVEAYKALRDPERRAAYDVLYERHVGFPLFNDHTDAAGPAHALSDAEAHAKVLHLLYKRRRESAQDAGVPRFFVQELLGCSDEIFEFHLWYLKEKGFIVTTEQGTLAITIQGIDHVISISQTARRERLLIGKSAEL